MKRLGEFDDQDGVFRGKADDGEKADLEIDIVGLFEKKRRRLHPEDAHRRRQEHGERYGPAFIQGGQTQEHQDKGQAVQKSGRGTGLFFLEGQTSPFQADTLGKLPGHLFDGGHGGSRTHAPGGTAEHFQ